MSRRRVLALPVAAALLLAGCSSGGHASPGSGDTSGIGTGAALRGTVSVFAAASLTGTFTQLGKQFEAVHPGVTVRFNFGASSTLAAQIEQGAPADVFASAATKNMTDVVKAGDATAPRDFVTNRMEIAVPKGNPAHVTGLADLAKPSVKLALCQPQVPCGAVAKTVFANAHLTVKPVTLENDVKSTLAKVTLGEADAAVVYVTDVRAAGGGVEGVAIPDDVNAGTTYPIAALTHAKNPSAAQGFVDYVLSPAGQAVLAAAGFGSP